MRAIRQSNFIKWFYLGINVKRWLLLMAVGVAILGLGFSYFLREVYASYTFPDSAYYVTLQFLPRWFRGILFLSISAGIILFAFWRLSNSLLSALVRRSGDESLASVLYSSRYLARGPKIVAIGGGTGLSTLLRGLKEYSGNLTAVVTVADDGGSSGRLRRELGILPPGDVRNCIAALADAEPLMTRLFQYRFSEGSGLEGHSFGNLFIVAMSGVTGSFEEAIRETSRVLAVRGNILPSTLANVTLSANTEDEEVIHGESNITDSPSRIREVYLQPPNVEANPDAVRAILERRHHHRRAGKPFHQRHAEPPCRWHPAGGAGFDGAQDIRLQRCDAARRDGLLHRWRPLHRAATSPGRALLRLRARKQQCARETAGEGAFRSRGHR